jgi:hypothetical protein
MECNAEKGCRRFRTGYPTEAPQYAHTRFAGHEESTGITVPMDAAVSVDQVASAEEESRVPRSGEGRFIPSPNGSVESRARGSLYRLMREISGGQRQSQGDPQ